jgi:hypothetical protein
MSNIFRMRNELHVTHAMKNALGRRGLGYEETLHKHPQFTATSVENWDELIEVPHAGCIVVRVRKN